MPSVLVHLDALWLGALLALPVTLGVAAACMLGVKSPATRHALWLIALLAFVAPAFVSMTSLPGLAREWGAKITARAPERPIPTDAPAARATQDEPASAHLNPALISGAPDQTYKPRPFLTHTSPGVALPAPYARLEQASSAQASKSKNVETSFHSKPALAERVPLASEPEPVEASPTLAQRLSAQTAPWIAAVREAIGSLGQVPPLPPLIWLGGVLIVLVMLAVRITLDRRLTRLALLATAPERAALAQAAATIGLRRPPELVFVPTRISPMVTCGVRRRLVMPRSLWRALDSDARQAVLLHELAHLRRRDHWTHWLSMAVGALYWWHPLVWVVRRQLRDEADLCCDAWVTALQPDRRRGYAETLLKTTAFLNVPGVRTHAAGLAMASPTKRKLARRITMVMTHTVRPKLSVHGSSLVAGAALLALLVMPGVACPPPEKSAPNVEQVKSHQDDQLDESDASTFDRHMRTRTRSGGGAQAPSAPQREDETLARLKKMETGAAKLRAALTKLGHDAPPPPPAPAIFFGQARVVPDAPVLPDADGKISRAYILPSGRLRALSSLMVRSDVPILVSPEGSRLVVHATPSQHETFAAFAHLISPDSVKIIGSGTNQRRSPVIAPQAPRVLGVAKPASLWRAEQNTIRSQAEAIRAEREMMLSKRQNLEGQAGRLERQADGVRHRASVLIDQAEMFRDRSEEARKSGMYEQAAGYSEQSEALIAQGKAMLSKAENFERKGEALERMSEELERQAEKLEAEAESREDLIEEYEERLEEMQEALADHLEEMSDRLEEIVDGDEASEGDTKDCDD